MKNSNLNFPLFALIALTTMILFSNCSKSDDDIITPPDPPIEENTSYALGWNADTENLEAIENDINIGSTFGTGNLPSSIDLTDKFPPIGNQGEYGTCVAWSVGYNLKTYLEAVDQGYSSSQLADPSRQFSPKDLYLSIPTNQRNACNGTNFEPAFDVMMNRGVATMQSVPYDALSCNSDASAQNTAEANNFKIESYREVNVEVNTLKNYLSQGRPVSFGAKLDDSFMQWNSEVVITSATSFEQVGIHAYHAMVIAGYDDNKGPNGAFRVINSWGTVWGSQGYIWIDYSFFVNEFAFCAFVAQNKASNFNPDENNNNQVDNEDIITGNVDLLSWYANDQQYGYDPLGRYFSYNVYNMGSETAAAAHRWGVAYAYYNAFDANDWGVLVYDAYTNEYGTYGQNGQLATGPAIAGNWWNHIDVAGGSSIAHAYGTQSIDWTYTMPSHLTGYYYFVVIADPYSVLGEYNEANNLLYLSDAFGSAIYVQNGIVSSGKRSAKGFDMGHEVQKGKRPTAQALSPMPSVKTKENPNAYSPAEITNMIKKHKASGKMAEKIKQLQDRKSTAQRILAD